MAVCVGAPVRVASWGDPQRPYRVEVSSLLEKQASPQLYLGLPLDFASDLAKLGLPRTVDPASLRVAECDPQSGEDQTPPGNTVAFQVRDDRIEWIGGATAVRQIRQYHLYFRTLSSGSKAVSAPATSNLRIPDYATDVQGRAWDFDDGKTAAIDGWGNKPEFIRRKVENGILKLDVTEDPYFIWGGMWGPPRPTQRPVKIELARYPVLEMRVRQSLRSAPWELYGRVGTNESLLNYKFSLSGTNWQTLRVDLQRDAGWQGTLSALRIAPTSRVTAHVEIDWIRLTPVRMAARGAVELTGSPSATPAGVKIELAAAAPRVGTEQAVTVRVQDATGRAVQGQPVKLALAPGSGGALDAERGFASLALGSAARRALTDVSGVAKFHYRVSRRAGPAADRLEATVEFSAVPPSYLPVAAQPRPPHHYVIEPVKPLVRRPGDPPPVIVARLADEFDNPLPGGQRALEWSAPGANLMNVEAHTAADGSARATLRVDAARQWVTRVTVKDAQGLSGESAPICALPAGPRPNPVRLLPNGYFQASNKPWLPLGGFYANWVGLPTPDGEWDKRLSFTDATDDQVIVWLKYLKANGVTAQRFMLRTHRKEGMEPMDIIGRVNLGLFAAFLHYLDLARPFGFQFLLVLHEDYTKPAYYDRRALERWCLPWYAGENLDALPPFQRRFIRDRDLVGTIDEKYTDPDVMACQDQYVREIIGLVKDNPLVFGYELENEMVNCPADWANHALAAIRGVDPATPLCVSHGGGGLHTADPAWWKEKTTIDFYTYHLYPHGTTSPEMDYGLALDVLTRYGRMGKPAFLGESSGDQFSYGPDRETRRWTMRDIVWFSLVNGNPGCFFWNARGSELAEFKLAHEIGSRVDWSTFRRKRPAIAVVVPHSLADDKWFRTAEGKAAYAMMGRYARHFLDRGANFDIALDGAGYALRADVKQFAVPEAPGADFNVSKGYQLASLVRDNDSEALVYLRNFGGVKLWETEKPHRWQQYLRERRPVPLRVTVRLPGRFTADLWDLDTGRHERRKLAQGEVLDLGASEHDFALHLKRSP